MRVWPRSPSRSTTRSPRSWAPIATACSRPSRSAPARASRCAATRSSPRAVTRPWHRCACSWRSSRGLVEQGLTVGQQTVDAIVGVLDAQGRSVDVLHDVVWRHRGKRIAPKTLNQKRYVDAIRSSTVTFGVGPAGTGKTYLAMALAVSALVDREVARIILTRPAVEAGERLGFLPGDMLAKVDPVPAPALRRALRHARRRPPDGLHGEGHDRGRAARVHARAHAQRLVHHPRRGAEHDARADADVPHAARLRLQDRRHGRPDAERPRARRALRPGRRLRGAAGHRRASSS